MSDYYEGKGCKCFARSESECSCEGVDWTPKEVYTLRKRIAELEQEYMALRLATLNAIQCMPGGQCKADLRDAYDKGGDV